MPAPSTIPADFAEAAHTLSIPSAIVKYGRNRDTIRRWFRRCGVEPQMHQRPKAIRPMPEGFADFYKAHTVSQTSRHFRTGTDQVMRWASELGLKRTYDLKILRQMTKPSVVGYKRSKATEGDYQRDMSPAGRAADFLQRIGPIYRCNDAGKQSQGGKFWRWGSRIKTDAEIMEIARFRGFSA